MRPASRTWLVTWGLGRYPWKCVRAAQRQSGWQKDGLGKIRHLEAGRLWIQSATGKIDKLGKTLGSSIQHKRKGVVREDFERHVRAMHLYLGFGRASEITNAVVEQASGGRQPTAAAWLALVGWDAWETPE